MPVSRTDEQLHHWNLKLDLIRRLEGTVLSRELCPEPAYWHWEVLMPELLPDLLKQDVTLYGEIRLY